MAAEDVKVTPSIMHIFIFIIPFDLYHLLPSLTSLNHHQRLVIFYVSNLLSGFNRSRLSQATFLIRVSRVST